MCTLSVFYVPSSVHYVRRFTSKGMQVMQLKICSCAAHLPATLLNAVPPLNTTRAGVSGLSASKRTGHASGVHRARPNDLHREDGVEGRSSASGEYKEGMPCRSQRKLGCRSSATGTFKSLVAPVRLDIRRDSPWRGIPHCRVMTNGCKELQSARKSMNTRIYFIVIS